MNGIRTIGAVTLFALQVLAACLPALRRPGLIVRQIYNSGARSLIIIMLSGLVVGMIAGLALLKELGPVLTALLFAGRAGTSLASEIGLMRATDQLTAMQVMAVDPMRHVVAPRFLGGLISMPLLVAIFNIMGLYGAQLIGVSVMGVDAGTFWSQLQNAISVSDVNEGLIKALVFGATCTLLAVYYGYNAEPTAEGVGLATTRTVISSSVLVLIFDYMLTAAFL
jgi:phospholipid/cholesterol/gamma-HCH transport system permease protein